MVLVSWSSRLMVNFPPPGNTSRRETIPAGHKVHCVQCKQASSHRLELTSKQCVSYNVASVDGVYVKQDDIYRSARHDRRTRSLRP